jgi:hypothetical protein
MAKKKQESSTKAAEYCGNCRFFKLDGDICQRYPAIPMVIDGEVFSVRPIMDSTEWCGEHQGPRQ